MRRSIFETLVGAIVLMVAAWFLVFAYTKSSKTPSFNGYKLFANFSSIDGLGAGTDVRISGVRVGTVQKITLDPKTYLAHVTLSINGDVKLPDDTVASVSTEGLLGGKFLALSPGPSDDMLQPNGTIGQTQSAASIERLLGQVIFSLQNIGKAAATPSSGGTPAPAPAPSTPAANGR